MHLDYHHSPNWRRAAHGLAAMVSWLLATLLFAGYTVMLRESLLPLRFLLGAAGWICGLVAFLFLARLFERD